MSLATSLLDEHRSTRGDLGEYFGVLLPAQFADPAAEYRIASDAAALLDADFHAVFSLAGPDRARYLNAVLTSNVRDLSAGQGALGLLLSPQGHILAELQVLALEERLIVFGHRMAREKTAQTLDKFIIMDDATLADETDAWGTLAIEGPAAREVVLELAAVDIDALAPFGHAPATAKSASGEIPCRVIRSSISGLPGAAFLAPRTALASLWSALRAAVHARGGAPIGYRAINALRLESGIPWFGADFDERHLPHEAGLEKSHISYTKGCYTGQEIVERVRSRGQVHRRLTGLRFSVHVPPSVETPLTAGGQEVGHITSAAFSPRVGAAIGLGYVRSAHKAPGTLLEYSQGTATVIELPIQRTK